MNTNWTLQEAVCFVKLIENYSPLYGFHTGLTGGCLYKEGDRKDIDIIFYPHNDDKQKTNKDGLLDQLAKIGISSFKNTNPNYNPRVTKATYMSKTVDLFFL